MNRISFINYNALWDRIGDYARKSGRVTTRPVLILYFVMKSKDTPWKDNVLIFTTLPYIVIKMDILDAKRLSKIDWFDEIASHSVTYQKARDNITPEMGAKVDAILDRRFPGYTGSMN